MQSNITYHPSLGLVSSHRRTIKNGLQYDRYFQRAPGKTIPRKTDASVYDTLDLMADIVWRTLWQTEQITKYLKSISSSTEQFVKNTFDFLYQNIQYKEDPKGLETVRQPLRSWQDRASGIDCDCFATFAASILTNAKIPYAFRIIKMKGRDSFHHVYVIVPKIKNISK